MTTVLTGWRRVEAVVDEAPHSAPALRAEVVARPENEVDLRGVYVEVGPRIRRFCAAMLRGSGDPDDVLQETFARACRMEPKPPRAEWVPWLFGIARNVAREHARLEIRTGVRDGLDVNEEPCARPSPEARLLDRERAENLLRALAELPEERRAALLLRSQEGLSCEQIATALGVSVAKVKVDIHRARAWLRERMGEEV